MDEPVIAAKEPARVEVKVGETYWWCRCGRSKSQPFCDGSHEGTAFEPMEYKADKDRALFFCQCKHTKKAPLCDGAHNEL
ncbi:MAG: CDGSH iron-sulfur domain-containing protein [Parvibaculaceae bacterium]